MKGLREMDFEEAIFTALANSPLYLARRSEDFSLPHLCDLTMMADYIRATQPAAWRKLEREYAGHEAEAVTAEINKLRPNRGLLELLRNGFSLAGVGKLELVTFKPATGFNAAHRARYEANRFAVVRQFHFSVERPNDAIDLVILLNGLPLMTMEVKNEFTGQTREHAERQYCKDRPANDPFLKACLVHFAVDNTTISMTTKLDNGKTRFLPFNRELKNPPIEGNYASSYLWEDVLRADSLLDLLQHYLHWEEIKDERGRVREKRLIFPRYHQLDAVRRLLARVREKGPGENYLIQHSAGSGKSNTIAWLAHQLSNFFNEDDQIIFDSVIIITDRRLLDQQLQDTVKQFERTAGVVKKIDQNTKQLLKALVEGEKIIVCTLQKFSWMQNVLGGPKILAGKHFALIVDEAHSSQTGDSAKDLKLTLTTPEALAAIIAEDDENREPKDPVAEELEKIMKARQRLPHISFFAFTATPKPKTLEVFGQNREPFHTYSMRQAIEEGFILDVLQNYTTYGTYFELIENEKAVPGYQVEKIKARGLLLKHVGKHPHTIEHKARIMLDHFFTNTIHKIGGQAKAMVVTSSRAHAVLYWQAIDKLLRDEYASKVQALVAFSGTVKLAGESYTEEGMNPRDAKDIRKAFNTQKYRLLIVANKFQTGFDQPLLHTMYVDKKLGGVAAVQTLSRLNRVCPPLKQDPMVLDFANTQEEIETAFQKYYGRTTLDRDTDPQKLYNMKFAVEEMALFTQADVDQFADLLVRQKASSQKISPIFTKIIIGKFAKLQDEAKDRFRDVVRQYVKQYSFVSQIIRWIDADLEKFYLFTKLLLKYIPPKAETLPEEILSMVDMDKFRLQEKENGSILLKPEDAELENVGDGTVKHGQGEVERLEAIVKELNERFHFDFEDRDKVMRIVLPKLTHDEGLVIAYQTDNLDALRKQKFSESLEKALLASAGDFLGIMNRMSEQADFKRLFEEFVLAEFKKNLTGNAKMDSTSRRQYARRT